MKSKKFIFIISVVILISCQKERNNTINDAHSNAKISQVILRNATPTVVIEKYNLISTPNESRQTDADEILSLKRQWPQIMQSPNVAGFDSILSKNFTFIDNGNLLNRANYITNRTKSSDWKITFVKYENLTLQFFGENAILTYRNHVKNENVITKSIEIEHIDWVDIYAKENDQWKISSAHVIDIDFEQIK